ncbi:MAG: sporulation integral membrane protein YtvI [Lachnospiraceae bacterium]|nr:sporulation integral membrane protein YtvI [Lachnospiraceae bacterium]
MKGWLRTYLKVFVNLGVAAIGLWVVVVVLPRLIIFFMPFVVGWIIALIANPLVHFFEQKLKIKRKAGTAFVIITVIGLVVLAGYLIGAKVVQEGIDLIGDLPRLWEEWEEDFRMIGKNMEDIYGQLPVQIRDTLVAFGDQMEDLAGKAVGILGTPTIEALGNFAKHLPTVIIGIIMCLLSAYFFVAERDYLAVNIKKHIPEGIRLRWEMVAHSLKRAVGGYFKAQFKIEIWMYLLLVIGFLLLGVEHALLIALGIACLDFLPVFGTGAVLIPWTVVKVLSADYQMALGLMIMWCGGQLVRQLIQPKIVGDSIGMPPIPTLFLLFIGYKLGGVVGMIVAVPLGIILVNLDREGMFDTVKKSIRILIAGINSFRRLEPSDIKMVEDYEAYEKELREQEGKEIMTKKSGEGERDEGNSI